MMSHPRTADVLVLIVASLSVFLLAVLVYASSHGPVAPAAYIEPCAAVQVRGEEQVCR